MSSRAGALPAPRPGVQHGLGPRPTNWSRGSASSPSTARIHARAAPPATMSGRSEVRGIPSIWPACASARRRGRRAQLLEEPRGAGRRFLLLAIPTSRVPERASEFDDPNGRRSSCGSWRLASLAGLTACTRQPHEKIVPYVRQPEEVCRAPAVLRDRRTESGFANGVLVESHMGRPRDKRATPTIRPSRATEWWGSGDSRAVRSDRSHTLTVREISPGRSSWRMTTPSTQRAIPGRGCAS
jgi:hypothetical protein